ncbi:hypothetical protein HD806DRAFT_522233 [Xylariaceae sp. AK1471]|nr:hypothetical protein HD806DRAFT_522233 [Xylariaceae sp. AK1471]
MTDTLAPQTTPKKLFKPSSKTKTPTPIKRMRTNSQPTQQTDSAQRTANDARSTSFKGFSSSFKDKISRAKESAKEPVEGLSNSITSKPKEALESPASSLPAKEDNPTDMLKSPSDIAEFFSDQGHPEMSNFVKTLLGNYPPGSSETTPKVARSPVDDTQDSKKQANQDTNGQKNNTQNSLKELPTDDNLVTEPNEMTKKAVAEGLSNATDKADDGGKTSEVTNSAQKPTLQQGSQDSTTPSPPEPADVSKTADGTFRETKDRGATATPTNKMGEPDVSKISQTAQPAVPNSVADAKKQQAPGTAQPNNRDGDTQVADNMGRPAHVERRIEIPLQRPEKTERPRIDSFADGLGDFEDLPGTENLPSTDDLPDIPDDESQDPPEEILDPSVHSTSTSITPIPKIPKIDPIDFTRPVDLSRRAKGLAGHIVDDVGNIVDASGKVLGHAKGDLPAMVGKKVSDNGEVYDDGGEIIGHVSENFINPPSPTEIPSDVLGGLKVDHEGNILDSSGNIIGKFHQKPGPDGSLPPFMQSASPKAESREKPKEEHKPKVNAHTGGSPSDLFLDVKSTTDGIQLTIRIPTTFSRPPPQDS